MWWRARLRASLNRIETGLEAEREQLPLWLPVGFGLGIAAWFALPRQADWIAFLLGAAGLVCVAAIGWRATRLGRGIALFAGVAALGMALIWGRAEWLAAPRLDRPAIAEFSGEIESVDQLQARGIVRLLVAPDRAAGLPPHVRVNVAVADAPKDLAPGMRVALKARLMPPAEPAVPGAYDFARIAWFQQLGATGKALGPVRILSRPQGWSASRALAGMRERLTGHIHDRLAGAQGGIAAAFVTGDEGAIPEEDADAMRRSGLAHLLSISGLHVTAVISVTMWLTLRLLALSPRLALHAPLLLVAAAAGALAGGAYTVLSGAEVPTVRSWLAAVFVLVGIALGREAITLRLVATAALVVLCFRPEALAGPSFQLSFAAVTAIVAMHEHAGIRAFFAPRDEGWPARLARSLASLLLTGLAVEAALAPIALYHFHQQGLYGALANIVAIPLTTFVIMPLEGLGLVFDIAGIGLPFWWLAGKAIALLLWIAHSVGAAPGSVAMLPGMPAGAYALLMAGALWLMLWRTRLRFAGLLPFAIGALWALAEPAPDLLITGDGRHMAVRTPEGTLALLRPRAGDYVRGMLGENAGVAEEGGALDDLPGARCGADLCAVELVRGGRRWGLLATRSPYQLPIAAMNRACAEADIVLSDRRLPRSCRPRWLKADRALLAQTGGLALTLGRSRLRTVRGAGDAWPWRAPSASMPHGSASRAGGGPRYRWSDRRSREFRPHAP